MSLLYKQLLGVIALIVFISLTSYFFMKSSEQKKISGYLTLVNNAIILMLPENNSFFLVGNIDEAKIKNQITEAEKQNKSVLFTGTGSFMEKPTSDTTTNRYLRVNSYETSIRTR